MKTFDVDLQVGHHSPHPHLGHEFAVLDGTGDTALATVWGGDEEAESYARLFAAAPRLLEALKDVSRILDAVRYTVGLTKTQAERLKRAAVTIARAEGGQS